MSDSIGRLTVFAVVCVLFGFSTHLFFGSILSASADEELNTVIIKDEFDEEENKHAFSGTVLVPTTCHDLTVRTHDFDSETLILVLESWKRPNDLRCEARSDLTPRSFNAIAFAPGWVEIKALYDGKFVPTRIIRKDIK